MLEYYQTIVDLGWWLVDEGQQVNDVDKGESVDDSVDDNDDDDYDDDDDDEDDDEEGGGGRRWLRWWRIGCTLTALEAPAADEASIQSPWQRNNAWWRNNYFCTKKIKIRELLDSVHPSIHPSPDSVTHHRF